MRHGPGDGHQRCGGDLPQRRDYVYQRLVDMGLDVEKPEGAFYMFVDIRKFGMDSNTFCTRMLKEGLVGVIPGIHFGTEGSCA